MKTKPDVTFLKKEHIFPKCIGGVNTLEKGVVSDQANELFSPLEKSFVRNSPIIYMSRALIGPQGRKKHDKKDSVMIMKADNGEYCLGYLNLGKPVVIDQVICSFEWENESLFKIVSCALHFDSSCIASTNYKSKVAQFISKLTEIIQKTDFMSQRIQVRSERIEANKILVGIFKGNLFVGLFKKMSVNQDLLDALLYSINAKCKKITENPQINKCRITCMQNYNLDLNIYRRMIGKIAFNCLAKLYGQEFVLQECFNSFRNMLMKGSSINQFFGYNSLEDIKNKSTKTLFIKKREHGVIFIQIGKTLYSRIYLYGQLDLFYIRLTNNLPDNCHLELNGYLCDWENHAEYRLIDLLCNDVCKLESGYPF